MHRYAVFGNPIKHSWSPLIHGLFAEQTAQRINYEKTCVAEDDFESAVQRFFAEGGKGLNITVPFKERAWELASLRSDRAQSCGAVNTLMLDKNGELFAENTDGIGLVSDICNNLHWPLAGASILLIGAGGAAKGVLQPLLKAEAKSLFIVNRTATKARHLAADFSCLGGGFDDIPDQAFDIIINASSSGLNGALPAVAPTAIASHTRVYDMLYGSKPTAFLRWASEQGCMSTADGLGMLVEQAAEAFLLWRGVRPQTLSVIEEVRQRLT